MKRVIQIAATAILGCLFFMQEGSAQTKKLYESKVDMKLPSYLHNCEGSYGAYETIDVKYTFKYYYDKDDNRINEGPIKITGNYKDYFGVSESAAVISANVSISGNYANDVLSGAMSATYNEKVEGRLWNDSYSLTLKTTFKNDVMVGSLTMDSSLNIEGKKEKQWWHITLDSNGKPKSIDCQVDGSKVKASYNDKGEATGVLVYDGETVKFTRGVATSFFKRKNGEECACGAEQKALLDKYLNGVYTEDDLFRAGYILASYEYPAIGFDEWALRCLNLRESNLGNFGSISMYIKQLEQLDILSYDDLVSYIDPEKAEGPFDWSDMQYDSNQKQVRLNGKWYYAIKSDVDRFEHLVDSIARVESSEFADFLFASQCTSDIYKTNKFKGRGFTLRYDGRNYENLVGLGKSSFKLDSLVRNQEYKHERVYDVHGVVTTDRGQNDGLYKMKVVLSITPNHLELSNPRWWVKVSKYEDIPTQWDKYRELKAKVIKQHEAIVSNSARYDLRSYAVYTTLRQRYDLNASEDYEQSMKVLKTLGSIQKKFLEYSNSRERMSVDNNKLIGKLTAYGDILQPYKKYFASLDYTWNPKEGMDVLYTPKRAVELTSLFLSRRKNIDAYDEKLKSLSAAAVTLTSIYDQWRQTADLTWTPDIDCEKLNEVIDIQKACLEILSNPNIAEIDKRIKRSKLTDLTAVIQFVNSGYESAPAADNSTESKKPKKEAVVKKVKEEKVKEVKVKETKVREYRNKGLIHTFQFDAQLPISNGTAKCNIFGGEYMIGYRFSDKLTLSGGVGFSYTTDYSEHLDYLKNVAYAPRPNASYVDMGGGEWLKVKEVRTISDNTPRIAVPIFVNVKYFFTKGVVQPFVSASAGAYVLPSICPKTEVGFGCNFRIGNRCNAYALLSLDTAVAPRREFVANYPDEDAVYHMDFNPKPDFLTPAFKIGFSF